MLDYSPALMTDMYEYTMLDACLKDGTANRKCVFEIFKKVVVDHAARKQADDIDARSGKTIF